MGYHFLFKNEAEEKPLPKFLSDDSDDLFSRATRFWQYDHAMNVVSNLLSTYMSSAEWKTYSDEGTPVRGSEWFKFNVSPNIRQTSEEFYRKLAFSLIRNRKALIIEVGKDNDLHVADSWSYRDSVKNAIKPNVFTNVTVDELTFMSKTFKEGVNCMYIELPDDPSTGAVYGQMVSDYRELRDMVYKGAYKSLGTKYALSTNATGKSESDIKYIKKLQEIYEPLMKKDNAVFLTYKGETLTDMTETQRGSEVEQLLAAVKNNVAINVEIMENVGRAFGIPKQVMLAQYEQENDSIYNMAITMFAKPILSLVSNKFSLFILDKESIIKGARIFADLESIRYRDPLAAASAIDKLIASGVYTINEIREKMGNDPVENGDVRFITKNYDVLDRYVKGDTE